MLFFYSFKIVSRSVFPFLFTEGRLPGSRLMKLRLALSEEDGHLLGLLLSSKMNRKTRTMFIL